MAQEEEYGAAQPIVDTFRYFSKSKKKAPPAKAVDTSWHEEMVRKANQSFADAAKGKTKAGASKRAVSQKLRAKRS